MDSSHHLKPRRGEAPTAAAGPDHNTSSSRGDGSRWFGGAAMDALLDGSGHNKGNNGGNGGRWLRRMLALVVVLHILLIAAVLWASPFDGHRGNHSHHNLPLAPEDAAAAASAAAAAVGQARVEPVPVAAMGGSAAGAGAAAGRGLVAEAEEEDMESEEEEEAANAAEKAAAAAAEERPEAFDECGVWQEGYMDLHRKILAGEAPQRYLVAVAYKGGLADQLVGIITTFYWALVRGCVRCSTRTNPKLHDLTSLRHPPPQNAQHNS
jgi:hypothetical protein